jgi:hypothetical protein
VRVAVGAHRFGCDRRGGGIRAQEGAEGAVHRSGFRGADGQAAGIDALAGERRGERRSGGLELVGQGAEHGQEFGCVRELSLPDIRSGATAAAFQPRAAACVEQRDKRCDAGEGATSPGVALVDRDGLGVGEPAPLRVRACESRSGAAWGGSWPHVARKR